MRYSDLATLHPSIDAQLDQLVRDTALGSTHMARVAGRYIHRALGETAPRHAERLREASFLPYVGPIVDSLVSHTMNPDLAVRPRDGRAPAFYEEFARDADWNGEPFAGVLRDALREALLMGRSYIGVDLPEQPDGFQPLTRAEELPWMRAYLYPIEAECVIDWKRGLAGTFDWLVLHGIRNERSEPGTGPARIVEEFRVWSVEDGRAVLTVYETPARGPDDTVHPSCELRVARRVETSFAQIPVLELRLPGALQVGRILAPINAEHFVRRSALLAAQARNLHPVAALKLGPENGPIGGAIPSETDAQDVVRSGESLSRKGFLILGSGDDLQLIVPDPSSYALIDAELKDLVDEMMRAVSLSAASVSSTSTALGRSGVSKQLDNHQLSKLCERLGSITRDYALRVWSFVSEIRGDREMWNVSGADRHDFEPRADLIAEAAQFSALQIDSPMFSAHYQTRLAQRLLGHPAPEIMTAITNELAEAVVRKHTQDTSNAEPDNAE